ncbi:YidC/Oxa1 family membrane protein insertase [Patescibacteria group bacterium]
MSIISLVWNEGLYRPLLNFLVLIYNTIPGHDIGVAIIILTAFLRFALWPLSQKSIKSQKALQDLQPKMKEIKKKHRNNKEKQAQATMEFYKKNKINPLGSCLPMLIQLPILIALYRVLSDTVGAEHLDKLYYFVSDPGSINPFFLGLIDLSKPDRFVLPILAGGLQFIQTKMLMSNQKKDQKGQGEKTGIEKMLGSQMTYFMPLITVFFAFTLPAGLPLYWIVTTLVAILQQWLIMRKRKPEMEKAKS